MGAINQNSFEIPETIQELLLLLNVTDVEWNVSLISKKGSTFGFLANDQTINFHCERQFAVIAGEQLFYSSNELNECKAFLQGLFLGVFETVDLEVVRRRVDKRKFNSYLSKQPAALNE